MASGDVKLALAAEVSMTATSLHSLASSATAGWQSASVDNRTNLYLDALVQVQVDFANTAPANDKAVYVYAYSGSNNATPVYTNPATGSQGTLTVPNITTNPLNLKLLGVIAYNTQDEVAASGMLSVAAAFGGILPPWWGIVVVNYSGAALAASGNSVIWAGAYQTVAP